MKIIVHIGPPKTATTSLQLTLEKLKHKKLHFAGAFNPRHRDVGSLNYRLFSLCKSERPSEADIGRVRSDIQALSDEYDVLLLSEEQLIVDATPSAEHRLTRLREMLGGFDCRIVLTMRSAEQVLPSFYQEVFPYVFPILATNFASFCDHKIATCYDHHSVCRLLHRIGLTDFRLIEFESLISGRLSLGDFTGCTMFDEIALTLNHANKGKTDSVGSDRLLQEISVRNTLGRLRWLTNLARRSGLNRWGYYKKVSGFLDKQQRRKARYERLSVPEHILQRFRASYRQAVAEYGVIAKFEGGDPNERVTPAVPIEL